MGLHVRFRVVTYLIDDYPLSECPKGCYTRLAVLTASPSLTTFYRNRDRPTMNFSTIQLKELQKCFTAFSNR
jgi:hypothetical protein